MNSLVLVLFNKGHERLEINEDEVSKSLLIIIGNNGHLLVLQEEKEIVDGT